MEYNVKVAEGGKLWKKWDILYSGVVGQGERA
jgi:hypothetical protein